MRDGSHPARACALALLALSLRAAGPGSDQVRIPASSLRQPGRSGASACTNYRIRIRPTAGQGPAGGVTPAQVRAIYRMPADAGQGTIAVVSAYHAAAALQDFNTYSARFGLPVETSSDPTAAGNRVLRVVYAAGREPDAVESWALESTLDIELAHALAPQARIVLVEAAKATLDGLYGAVAAARALPGVTQVSMSWSFGESADETGYDRYFQGDGPVFLAAAGDEAGAVYYPAASRHVVAVGGTRVDTDGQGGFLGESAWSDGGGGLSAHSPKPGYQEGVANTGPRRSLPDLACLADQDPGFAVYGTNPFTHQAEWMVLGGTSCSTACMAGMLNSSGARYASSAAFLENLYRRFGAGPGAAGLRDITTGGNGHPALPGWDFATGLGVPDGPGAF